MENPNQYPSNSVNPPQKAHLEAVPSDTGPKEKVIRQVVTEPVKRKKRGLGKAFAEFFGGEDGRSVGEYVVMSIVAPAIQQMLFQVLNQSVSAAQRNMTNAINRGFSGGGFGFQQYPPQQTQYPQPLQGNYVQTRTPYNQMGNAAYPQPAQPAMISPGGRRMHNFDEIIITDLNQANEVIAMLQAFLQDYPNVSVADLYQIIGERVNPVDNEWGWNDLSTARIVQAPGGFRLALPRPQPLRNYPY